MKRAYLFAAALLASTSAFAAPSSVPAQSPKNTVAPTIADSDPENNRANQKATALSEPPLAPAQIDPSTPITFIFPANEGPAILSLIMQPSALQITIGEQFKAQAEAQLKAAQMKAQSAQNVAAKNTQSPKK